jgi:alkaline phosphatase D
VPQNPDQWDGYPREREEVLRHLLDRGIQDTAVITGDIHAFFTGDVHLSGRQDSPAAATEFVGGSISSGGFENAFGPAVGAAERGLRLNNPHLKYTQFTRRGYAVMECRPDELLVTYRSPTTVTERTATMETIGRFRVPRGTPSVEVL